MGVISFLPWLISAAGVYFIFKLKVFFFRHPIKLAKEIGQELKKPKSFSSLMLALSGTLGVGNIVGVAVGVSVGGAGAVFWLMISSLFSSVIKYCEVTIATDKSASGMMTVISKSFGNFGGILSKLYCILCLTLSLTMGCALQARSIGEAAEFAIGASPTYVLIPLVIVIAFFIFGGADIIERGVKYIIPLTTMLYIIMCLCVILPNASGIPSIAKEILYSAFDFNSAAGGFIGFFTSYAIREGFARGMLSNEAGAGTSALAHSRADERKPSTGGLFGMLEVIFDTVILCPLTAISLLLSGVELSIGSGVSLVMKAFSGYVIFSDLLLFISILFFALSTILCWYYYGSFCYESLFGGRTKFIYTILFLSVCSVGLFFSSSLIISVSDTLLFFMSIISLLTLAKNSRRIFELSYDYIK